MRFPWAFPIAQLALLAAAFALGGTSTKPGVALLLASLWFFGAAMGWLFRGGR